MLLTVAQVAALSQVHRSKVYDLPIVYSLVGRRRRYSRKAVDAYLRREQHLQAPVQPVTQRQLVDAESDVQLEGDRLADEMGL
jgi:hypothetical protein